VANYGVSNNISKNSNKEKNNNRAKGTENCSLSLFTYKRAFLNIPVRLQTETAAKTHLAEGQGLEKQLNLTSYVCSSRNKNSGSFDDDDEVNNSNVRFTIS
jgi:hypothetical protein